MRVSGNQWRRLPRAERFWAHVRTADSGCWEWLGKRTPSGYGLFYDDDGKERYAHRIAFELENGPLGGDEALHECDNPPCVRPSHLFRGTQQANVADMVRKGRARGKTLGRYEIDGRAKKLDAIERALVAEDIRRGVPHSIIAAQFGVTEAAIYYHARRLSEVA